MELLDQAADRYLAVRHVIPPVEWPVLAGDVAAILAHNYQHPVIVHGVVDVTGDSLAFAEKACSIDADVLVVFAESRSWRKPSNCSTLDGLF